MVSMVRDVSDANWLPKDVLLDLSSYCFGGKWSVRRVEVGLVSLRGPVDLLFLGGRLVSGSQGHHLDLRGRGYLFEFGFNGFFGCSELGLSVFIGLNKSFLCLNGLVLDGFSSSGRH